MNSHISEYSMNHHHSTLSNGNIFKSEKSLQMHTAGEIYQDDDSGLDMERSTYSHLEQNELNLVDSSNSKKYVEEKKFFYDFMHLIYDEMVVKTPTGQTRGMDISNNDNCQPVSEFYSIHQLKVTLFLFCQHCYVLFWFFIILF